MNKTSNVSNEILNSIDNMNTVTLESSLDVLFSLADAYEKSVMITEYSTSEDLGVFSIFQEADQPPKAEEAKPAEGAQAQQQNTTVKTGTVPADATRPEVKKTNTPQNPTEEKQRKGILWFIPNLLRKIWQFLKDTWNGVIVPKAQDVAATVSETTKSIFEQVEDKDESWIKEHAKELGIAAGGTAMASLLAYVSYCKKDNLKEIIQSAFGKIQLVFKAIKTAPRINFSPTGVTTDFDMSKVPGLLGKIKTVYNNSMKAVKDLKEKGVGNKEAFSSVISTVTAMTDVNSEDCRLIGEAKKMTYESFLDGLNECIEGVKNTGVPEEEIPKDDGNTPDIKPEDEKDMKNADSKTSLISRALTGLSEFFKAVADKVKNLLKLRKKVTDDTDAEKNGAAGEAGEGTGENAGENASEAGEGTTPPEGEVGAGENASEANEGEAGEVVASEGEGEAAPPAGEASEEESAAPPTTTFSKGSALSADELLNLAASKIPDVSARYAVSDGHIIKKRNKKKPTVLSGLEKLGIPDVSQAVYNGKTGKYILEYSEEEVDDAEDIFAESAVEEELTDEQIAINNHWYR